MLLSSPVASSIGFTVGPPAGGGGGVGVRGPAPPTPGRGDPWSRREPPEVDAVGLLGDGEAAAAVLALAVMTYAVVTGIDRKGWHFHPLFQFQQK